MNRKGNKPLSLDGKIAPLRELDEVDRLFKFISLENLKLLLGVQEFNDYSAKKINELVKSLSRNNFYDIKTSFHNGGLVSFLESQNYERLYHWPDFPVLIPILDEINFYIKSSLYEATDQWFTGENIPNREFLQISYPWNSLLSLIQLKDLDRDSLRLVLSSLGKSSYYCNDYSVSITFFSIKGESLSTKSSPSRSRHIIYSKSDWIEFIDRSSNIIDALLENGYCYIGFKKLPSNACNTINKKKGIYEDKKALVNLISSPTNKPKTFVIFCDSLDLNLLENVDSELFPNIRSFIKSSVHFENFVSSGAWTFPNLHSIHTGISPHKSFSIFPLRANPIVRIQNEKPSKNNLGLEYFYNLLSYINNFNSTRNSYLTTILKSHGLITAGVKGSKNHGWYHGLTHCTDFTIENTYLNNLPSNIVDLYQSIFPINIDLFFADLEFFHRPHTYNKNPFIKRHTSNIDSLFANFNKKDRLEGNINNHSLELSIYKDRMEVVDYQLAQILELSNTNDNIILFSDNGSDLFTHDLQQKITYKNTSVTASKIFSPTLLIRSPKIDLNKRGSKCSDLISTVDLHSIILNFHGIKSTSDDSILPEILGGKEKRKEAYILSYFMEKNESNERLKLELTEYFERKAIKCHEYYLADFHNEKDLEVEKIIANILKNQ